MRLLSQQPYCASLTTGSGPPNRLPLPLGHPHLLPKWHFLFRAKVHLRHVFTPGKKGRYHAVWVAISFGRSSLCVRALVPSMVLPGAFVCTFYGRVGLRRVCGYSPSSESLRVALDLEAVSVSGPSCAECCREDTGAWVLFKGSSVRS